MGKWEGAKRRREEGGKGHEGETPTPYPPLTNVEILTCVDTLEQ